MITRESRWIFRFLWLVVGGLAISILTVRTSGLLDASHRQMDAQQQAGSSSFTEPLTTRDTPQHLDSIAWTDHRSVAIAPHSAVQVSAGSNISIVGWAYDSTTHTPMTGIGAKIDDRPEISAGVVRLSRPDVAAALGDSRARESGFDVDIDTSNVPLGHHVVSLRGLVADGQSSVALGSVAIVLRHSVLGAQTTDSIDALNGVVVNRGASLAVPIGILRSTTSLTVSGWGFVTDGRRLATSITILVDGNSVSTARYGLSRADVARLYHDVRVTRCGFEGLLPLTAMTRGNHEIQFRLSLSDGSEVNSASVLRIALE